MKKFSIILLLSLLSIAAGAQIRDFKQLGDSLGVILENRTGVRTKLKVESVSRRDGYIDIRFNKDLADYPWREGDAQWLANTISELLPASSKGLKVRKITANKTSISELYVPIAGNSGKAPYSKHRVKDPRNKSVRPVRHVGATDYPNGLSNTNIALWQSHGLYYAAGPSKWTWQRSSLFGTCEDMYTQAYVLPFLIPMLENAGAYVMTPRERDIQQYESICDNDDHFNGSSKRYHGTYREFGDWFPADTGFADIKASYSEGDNPFKCGTARQTAVKAKADAHIVWRPYIPDDGEYAVYISYKTLKNSSSAVRYRVKHRGGMDEFIVNQRIGGGTWIYLGTFPFECGDMGFVEMDNGIPEGSAVGSGAVVTADAVRFGGGMGKFEKGYEGISGFPAYCEAAHYSMLWAGVPKRVYEKWDDDYTRDYASRGNWTSWISGGSAMNPEEDGLGIPIDLSLAFHSDAGMRQSDSTVGTLAIYTSKCEKKTELPNGESRMNARYLCDYIQSQIVEDVRREYVPNWNRRQLTDRNYSESRTPAAPAMLLELLSHQNFEDQKYGFDPAFRFSVSRAVYKGMLKYLSGRYGFPYVVQPLPIRSFAVGLNESGDSVRLSWLPRIDSLEATASPTRYIVQTRVEDGVFDDGIAVQPQHWNGRLCWTLPIAKGKLHSYRIIAENDGGRSFPSEILSAASVGDGPRVMVVNNFTRVSAPTWFDTPDYAGFNVDKDGGVAYIQDILWTGRQYEFRRNAPWMSDDDPGFGSSSNELFPSIIKGNSFDFVSLHAADFMELGYNVVSSSVEALPSITAEAVGEIDKLKCIDLLCGKQTGIARKTGRVDFRVFPEALVRSLENVSSKGINLLVSGSYIGSDFGDEVYPGARDSLYTIRCKAFTSNVLGWVGSSTQASRSGAIRGTFDAPFQIPYTVFCTEESPYKVESPDAIFPTSSRESKGLARYTDSWRCAGVAYSAPTHRAISFGFPIESIPDHDSRIDILKSTMKFFEE